MLQVEESLKIVPRLDFPPLAEIIEHVLKNKGKRIRPALALLAGKLFDRTQAEAIGQLCPPTVVYQVSSREPG